MIRGMVDLLMAGALVLTIWWIVGSWGPHHQYRCITAGAVMELGCG